MNRRDDVTATSRTPVDDSVPNQISNEPPRWATIVLWLISIPNVLTGAWALLSPQGWYDNFPGYAPRLVSAYPPFNEHLATDAGAGLLAVGVLAASAAVLRRRDAHLAAGAGLVAFTVPHALFHVLNPSELLDGAENASSAIPLVITAVASVAIMVRAATVSAVADPSAAA